jgi:hypothetical protein
MRRATTVTMLTLTLGLVACKGNSGGASASTAASAGASAQAPAGTTATANNDTPSSEAPLEKEGLWSVHTVTVENPGDKKREGNQSVCRNHAYDEYGKTLAKRPECKNTETFTHGTLVSESDCTVGGSVIHTKGTVTFTGDTAAHGETHSTYTPPAYGVADSTMVMDQKYVGPCPAGTEPGDIMGADGHVQTHWKQRMP